MNWLRPPFPETEWTTNQTKALVAAVTAAIAALVAVLAILNSGGTGTQVPSGTATLLQPVPVTTSPFKAASFNLFGCTESAAGAGKVAPWKSCTERVPAQWSYITGHRFSVVGFQEVEAAPFGALKTQAARIGWGIYPRFPAFTYAMSTDIGWDTKVWAFIQGSTFAYPMYEQANGSYKPAYGAAVQLRNVVSGKTIWVMSVHNASTSSTKHQQAAFRLELPIETALYSKYSKDGPVLLVGDFNDDSNLSACAFKTAVSDTVSAWGYPRGCATQIRVGEPFDKILGHGITLTGAVEDWSTQSAHLTDHGVPSAAVGLR